MKRASGILLHPTSLPSPYGIGDFGFEAYKFVDFLQKSEQKIWEVLPLTVPGINGSPYSSSSSMAGNWLLISPELLVCDGLLDKKNLPEKQAIKPVKYTITRKERLILLKKSFNYFQKKGTRKQKNKLLTFQKQEAYWLDNYALFMAIKDYYNAQPWYQWPKPLANRNKKTLLLWTKKLSEQIAFHKYCQWLFFTQWYYLKTFANRKGIRIFGDVPFFVVRDSVDVWANKKLFLLDKKNKPTFVAGVPPDYFSAKGQIWGNPQYNWPAVKKTKFNWMVRRFQMAFRLYDMVRVDHFRGYRALWYIKRDSKDAKEGKWIQVPGEQLFYTLKTKLKRLPVVAEDLGFITRDVIKLRNKLNFPGMRVMIFGFSGEDNNFHLAKNFPTNSVAYTGTHDTDTARGWVTTSGRKKHRAIALKYLKTTKTNFAWKLIQLGIKSKANTLIIPLQDILNLDSKSRFNKPSTLKGNWQWRFKSGTLSNTLIQKLREVIKRSKR